MYEYIKGNLVELTPTYAILDNQGVGFYINISLSTYAAIQGKESVILYVYENIREDAFIFYGFAEKNERAMFLLLVSVSGVGANTARMILSSLSVAEISDAIANSNVGLIKGVKGIGQKTAERIIVDLKNKIGNIDSAGSVSAISVASNSEHKAEAVSALVMLGFASNVAQKAVNKLVSQQPDMRVEELIKNALKMM